MADATVDHGFPGLSETRPAGALAAYAAPVASQAALRGRLTDQAFRAAAETALGAPLPEDSRRSAVQGPLTLLRLGPDYWLALHATDAAFAERLEAAGAPRALDLSSARTQLRLDGPGARDLLSVGCQIDLRPRTFPAGAFAQTPIGNATAILHATGDDAFAILIARSFAQSWLGWLAHAGREFDLAIAIRPT